MKCFTGIDVQSPENENTPPEERPDWPLPSFDARDWAKAFLKTYDKGDDGFLCEDTMVAWFAKALMRGYDEHAAKSKPSK